MAESTAASPRALRSPWPARWRGAPLEPARIGLGSPGAAALVVQAAPLAPGLRPPASDAAGGPALREWRPLVAAALLAPLVAGSAALAEPLRTPVVAPSVAGAGAPAAGGRASAAGLGPAAAAAATSLEQPGCRAALGLSPSLPAVQALRADPGLAARVAATAACGSSQEPLARLERLEAELAASRQRIAAQQAQLAAETARQDSLAQDLAALRHQFAATTTAAPPGAAAASATAAASAAAATVPSPAAALTSAAPSAPAATPPAGGPAAPASGLAYTPGRGFNLQAGDASLSLRAEARLLGFSSSRYVFNPGQPLVVSPKNPDASYDLSAQQSTVSAAFQGPAWGRWTPGAYALFTLQDNLLAEGYSFTPVVYYGEISDGRWRIAAGQNFDVFAPRDPDNLTNGKLAASGNPGSYRPQFRVERSLGGGSQGFGGALQLAVSSPITTALPTNVDLANLQTQKVVEDNGWPNLEARLNLGFGAVAERAGGRRLRPVELGVSGLVGQLRVLDNIRPTDPLTLVADRSTLNVWGAAFDGQIALGRRLGLNGELYTGQGLGEYMAGILQSYNRTSNQAVPTAGGWGQLYVYPADNLRLNVGYGVDHTQGAGPFSLTLNSAAFANVLWDVNPWLQLGLEGNYRFTTYDRFGDKDAWVVISQVLFRL